MPDDGVIAATKPKNIFQRIVSAVTGSRAFGGLLHSVAGATVFLRGQQIVERDRRLIGARKYKTFFELMVNVDIVGTGVRTIVDLIAKAQWTHEPADDSAEAKRIAALFDEFIADTERPWDQIIRRVAMFPFMGFHASVWTAKKRPDGVVGLLDLDMRPCSTIEKWTVDQYGKLVSITQRNPMTGETVDIERERLLYLVDDAFTDSTEGVGLLRQAVSSGTRYLAYERLEGIGFETDMRGILKLRAPIGELRQNVLTQQPGWNDAEVEKRLRPLKDLILNHEKDPAMGILLDSETERTTFPSNSPSGTFKWDAEIMNGGDTGLPVMGNALDRLTWSLARMLGVEHLLLGQSRGTQALSEDKSINFGGRIDGTMNAILGGIRRDVYLQLMDANGWDRKLTPWPKTDKIQVRTLAEVSAFLKDMAFATVPPMPDDPAIPIVYDLAGLPAPDPVKAKLAADLMRERAAEGAAGAGGEPDGAVPSGNGRASDFGN